MDKYEVWAMVACMTLITFLTRGFFLLIAHHAVIPQRVQRALRYAPAAALAAIIVPDLVLGAGGTLNIGLDNHRLITAIVTSLCFVVRRGVIQLMLIGMLAYTALRFWA